MSSSQSGRARVDAQQQRANLLGEVEAPAAVVNEPQLAALGREAGVRVIPPQDQPELRAARQHAVRLPQVLQWRAGLLEPVVRLSATCAPPHAPWPGPAGEHESRICLSSGRLAVGRIVCCTGAMAQPQDTHLGDQIVDEGADVAGLTGEGHQIGTGGQACRIDARNQPLRRRLLVP